MSVSKGAGTVRFDYTGAKVLVTGGTSGIGAGVAAAYRDAGAQVAITGTRASASAYDTDLSGFTYHTLDVTNSEQIARVADALPAVDIIVHCGGVGLASLGIDEYEPDNYELAVRMHLTSVYRLSKLCLDKLSASKLPGGGSVIGMASQSSFFGNIHVPGYGSAKGGLVQLMKTMAVAWSSRGVRANAVAPGMIRSRQTAAIFENAEYSKAFLERTPMRRLGEPDDVSDAVLFLTSGSAGYITGQTLSVCGGFSISG